MAAKHMRYKKNTLTFTPSGGAAVPITGVTGLTWRQGGQTTDLISDASELVQELPLATIKGEIGISTIAQEFAAGGLALGAGTVAFTIEQVKSGRGAVAAADITVTAPNAVITDLSGAADSGAGASNSISVEVADKGSGALLEFS